MKTDEGPEHSADEPSDVFRHIALGADVGSALIKSATLREALQRCAEAMVRHLDVAFARIWVLNEKEGVLELQASAGLCTHINGPHAKIPVAEYPYKIAVIAREGKPHLTNSVIGDAMIHDQEWAKKEGLVAFAGLPLVFRDRVIGVVAVFARNPLPTEALKALESVADEITLGIERKHSSRNLKKSEEMFRKLVEESLAGAYIIVDGRLVFCNQALASIYGYSKEELGGSDIRDITPEEDLYMEEELNNRLLSGDVPSLRYETRRVRKDGAIIHVEMLRWKTEYEEKPAIIGTAIDITERKTIERERADFLAMITHDFRTPLTNIIGYSQLLMQKPTGLHEDSINMLDAIYRNGDKLSGMVEDFLVHSKLECGMAAPEKIPGDIEEMLKKIGEEFAHQAARKRLAFELTVSPGLPRVPFDRKLLERAVSNLLQNAIVYTPEGGRITVSAELAPGPHGDFAAISVSDNGVGIPAELKPKIFDKYFRSPKTSGAMGTGLGLAVVKAVVIAHEGKVEVDSLEGEGCTFRILLPIGPQEKNWAA